VEEDDTIVGEIVQISKLGYISKNFEMDVSQAGTTQMVCLNPSPHGTTDPNAPTGRGNSCFTGDTRITLPDGSERPVALIRKGDFVLGRSGQSNRVIGIERPLLGGRKLYALNGGVPFVTAEHPFLTAAGWKAIDPEATAAENPKLVVGRLEVKDVLLKLQTCAVPVGPSGSSGESIEVVLESIPLVSMNARHADPATPLYNLLLEGDHAYFANGLLVHNKCLIVSAATGSSESVEVRRLQQLRSRIATASCLGGQLVEAILRDYYQFSPEIAAELERDEVARKAVLLVVVRPLVAWYTLAGTLGIGQASEEGVSQAVQDLLSACAYYPDMTPIIDMLEAISAGRELHPTTPPLLLEVGPRIREAARFRFASWAILDPLVRTWQSAINHLDPVDEVAQWLASTPLDVFAPPTDMEALYTELGVVARFFDFKPAARRQLGERLTAAWPHAASALERAGFVSQVPNREEEQ
jgi:hypothetical protein